MTDSAHVSLDMDTANPEDDDLYEKRNKVLLRLKIVAVLMIGASFAWIAVGIVTIIKAAPDNHLPYRIGGGCIGGAMGLWYALLILCMSKEGRKRPSGKRTTSGAFKCLTRCHFVMEAFLWVALLVGFGISGIWGTIECAMRTREVEEGAFSLNFCEPDKNSLYVLSIFSLILGAISMILLSLTNCMFCCNLKAFGMKYHQYRRTAYIDYHADDEVPTTHQVPASEPLYIRTDQGFQRVDVIAGATPSVPTSSVPTPSAPPMTSDTSHDGHNDRKYGRSHYERRDGENERRTCRDRPRDRPPDDGRHNRRPHDDRRHRERGPDDRPHDKRPPDDRRSRDRRQDERQPRNRRPDDRDRDRRPDDRGRDRRPDDRGRDRRPDDRGRDRQPDDRGRDRRPDDRDPDDRTRPGHRQNEDQYNEHPSNNRRAGDDRSNEDTRHTNENVADNTTDNTQKLDQEDPPPSYSEVIKNTLRKDDV